MIIRRSRKICQRGYNFDDVFILVDGGRKDPNATISRPDNHQPATQTPFKRQFRWHADVGPTLNAGLVAL